MIDHLLVMVSACFAVRDEARDSTEVPPAVSPPGVVEDCSIDGFFCLDGELTCGQGRAAIQNRLGDLAVRLFIANSLLVTIFATYALLLVQNGRHIILANRYSRPAIQRFDCLSPTSRLTLVVVMIGMGCEHGFVRQVSKKSRMMSAV